MIEKKFSFSLLRLHSFEFCRRAYFYRYLFSWGGWERSADLAVQEAYRLKNLKTAKQWISDIFRRTVRHFIVEHASTKSREADLFKIARIEFQRAWEEAIKAIREPDAEGKLSSILELKENWTSISTPLFRESLVEELQKLLSAFAESKFKHDISSIPYFSFRNLMSPEKFDLDGLTIYVSPDFFIVHEGKIEIINIHVGNFCENRNWDIAAGLSAIFAEKKCMTSKFLARSVFFSPNELSVWAERPHNEISQIIKTKSREMLEFEAECFMNLIPPIRNDANCHLCEFRKLCD
jgi:hypothetical protein